MSGYESSIAAVVVGAVIPPFVEIFYGDSPEGVELQEDFFKEVQELSKDITTTFQDVIFMLTVPKVSSIFTAISTLAVHVEVYSDFNEFFSLAEEASKVAANMAFVEDPIVNNRDSGKVDPGTYREYAKYIIRDMSSSVVLELLGNFIHSLPKDVNYTTPIADLQFRYYCEKRSETTTRIHFAN